jgi:hypothetical protein
MKKSRVVEQISYRWITGKKNASARAFFLKGLVIFLALGMCIEAGCSAFSSRFGGQNKKEVPEPVSLTPSLLDSLWRAPLPVDTVVLAERHSAPVQAPVSRYEYRLGPASAEISNSAQVPGYRVQLASAEEREILDTMRLSVERELETRAYVEKHYDLFTLRIGDYIRHADAEAKRRQAVSYGFKNAWIVQTFISQPE